MTGQSVQPGLVIGKGLTKCALAGSADGLLLNELLVKLNAKISFSLTTVAVTVDIALENHYNL
jgi:hypothetical protein